MKAVLDVGPWLALSFEALQESSRSDGRWLNTGQSGQVWVTGDEVIRADQLSEGDEVIVIRIRGKTGPGRGIRPRLGDPPDESNVAEGLRNCKVSPELGSEEHVLKFGKQQRAHDKRVSLIKNVIEHPSTEAARINWL